MNFIKSLFEKHRQKSEARNNSCNELIFEIDDILCEAETLLNNNTELISPEIKISLQNKASLFLTSIQSNRIKPLKRAKNYKTLLSKQKELSTLIQSFNSNIASHNNLVSNEKAKEVYSVIGDVEGKKLDNQQLNCISKNIHNHLIIAGAGTGKTTTVVGKIKYLLKTNQYCPKDILVLSFTHASATEMNKRIHKETGENIAASTFHKLGMQIITTVEGKKPKITTLNLTKFIKEQLFYNLQNKHYLKLLNHYLLYKYIPYKSEFDFNSQQEYVEYLKINPPITLRHEEVKSYGELYIANFLYENGIEYCYEAPYKIDTVNEEYGQYHPDFYLPEHDIYIEYFGINRAGEVPPYFNSKPGMTPSETYRASMQWKRELHKTNQTKMIECYAYEEFEDILIENLKNQLENNEIKLSPKSPEELWQEIQNENSSVLDGFIELFETLINLIKSNNYTFKAVRNMVKRRENKNKNLTILSLLEPIYQAYCQYLGDNQEIDFTDMINLATKYIQDGKFKNPYSYVIVDEYQDISKARYLLLKALRESKDYDLFCVGDDWQSIYRFAGSDIGYVLNFSKYWGPTEISKIETTYRFSQNLIDITGQFIMCNPMQIKKNIKGKSQSKSFPLSAVSGYNDYYAVEFMVNCLDDLPLNSTVYFIGRYSFDVNILKENSKLKCHYDNQSAKTIVTYINRKDLKMEFLTAHKSKGLQADYVFIINNKNSKIGFPSKVQEAPILELLLDNCDTYPFAEERRLFYVAMTRAKKKVILLTVENKESIFFKEIHSKYGDEIKKEQYTCPLCGGRLIIHSGPYGEFFGCSNYRTLGCKYTRNIKSRF